MGIILQTLTFDCWIISTSIRTRVNRIYLTGRGELNVKDSAGIPRRTQGDTSRPISEQTSDLFLGDNGAIVN